MSLDFVPNFALNEACYLVKTQQSQSASATSDTKPDIKADGVTSLVETTSACLHNDVKQQCRHCQKHFCPLCFVTHLLYIEMETQVIAIDVKKSNFPFDSKELIFLHFIIFSLMKEQKLCQLETIWIVLNLALKECVMRFVRI